MKKSIKLISILMIALMIISIVSPVFATDTKFDPTPVTNTEATGLLNTILGYIKYIGLFAAVAMMMILGIKYMMGSAEEKAEYKKVFIPYIIGIVLLLAATVIVGVIQGMVGDATKGKNGASSASVVIERTTDILA